MLSASARRELLAALVGREMKGRYKGSALGLLWSLLTPLFMAGIYAFFFRLLSGRAANTQSILVGVFAWQFTSNCVHQGMNCITGNANLVKKVAFPRRMLPMAVTVAAGIDYLISLVVQLGLIAFLLHRSGTTYTWTLAALPLVFLLHAIFNLGLAFFLSALNVYFRDTQHLVGVGLSALFFLSPAMYDLSFVARMALDTGMDPRVMDLYLLNPLAGIFSLYRWAFLGTLPPLGSFFWAGIAWPFVFTPLAALFFRRMQRNFADHV